MSDEDFAREHDDLVRGTAMNLARELDLVPVLDDLVAYGFAGLFEARRRFDPDKGVPFAGFASYRIRGAILDGVRQMGTLSRKTLLRVLRAADALLEQAGEERAMRGPGDDVASIASAFDGLFGKLTGGMLVARLAEEEQTPETRLIHEVERARLRGAMAALPEREQTVLRGMYFEDRVLDDIGGEIGLSRSGASRVHTRALELLRDQLGSFA